jgi:DNA-binding transcriptional MerR regulator
MALEETARYQIRTTARKTGLTESVLREWERRYGVPKPQRAASRYRLYSDADISQIEAMKKLIADGTAHAQAAEIVKMSSKDTEQAS